MTDCVALSTPDGRHALRPPIQVCHFISVVNNVLEIKWRTERGIK